MRDAEGGDGDVETGAIPFATAEGVLGDEAEDIDNVNEYFVAEGLGEPGEARDQEERSFGNGVARHLDDGKYSVGKDYTLEVVGITLGAPHA